MPAWAPKPPHPASAYSLQVPTEEWLPLPPQPAGSHKGVATSATTACRFQWRRMGAKTTTACRCLQPGGSHRGVATSATTACMFGDLCHRSLQVPVKETSRERRASRGNVVRASWESWVVGASWESWGGSWDHLEPTEDRRHAFQTNMTPNCKDTCRARFFSHSTGQRTALPPPIPQCPEAEGATAQPADLRKWLPASRF